jgi:hypothetical protein
MNAFTTGIDGLICPGKNDASAQASGKYPFPDAVRIGATFSATIYFVKKIEKYR